MCALYAVMCEDKSYSDVKYVCWRKTLLTCLFGVLLLDIVLADGTERVSVAHRDVTIDKETGVTGSLASQLKLVPPEKVVAKAANDSYFVSCSAGPSSFRLMWIKPSGEQITEEKDRIHVEESRDGHGLDLIFEHLHVADKGVYTCSANVDGVDVVSMFNLTVLRPITFVDTPSVQTAPEGSNFVIRCEADGDPQPTVDIKKSGSGKNGRHRFSGGDGFIVENVTLEDEGIYVCRAFQLSSVKMDYMDKLITFKVEHKPIWQKSNSKSDIAYGFVTGTVNITCEAKAEPPADFEWFKDKEKIEPSDGVEIYQDDNSSVLQLVINNSSTFGDYVCKASNSMGTLERVIVLEEGARPGIPTYHLKASTADTIELQISDPPEHHLLEVVAYRVQYKMAQESWDQAKTIELAKGSPFVLPGVNQETEYTVRVSARNEAGVGDYGPEAHMKTRKLQADPVTDTSSTATSLSSWKTALLWPLVFLIAASIY